MMGTRYKSDGTQIEVEEIFVEYSFSGTITGVQIFNDLIDDWVEVDIEKLSNYLKEKIQEHIENEPKQIIQARYV
jgi:uncharacterized protein YuzE